MQNVKMSAFVFFLRCERRAKWLKEKLPDILERDKEGVIAKFIATSLQGDEKRNILLKADPQKTNSETKKEGDDQ